MQNRKVSWALWLAVLALLQLCGVAAPQAAPATSPTQPTTRPLFQVGEISDPAVAESSGIVESRKYPGVFWTHNDSGNAAQIFAMDRDGKVRINFHIGAKNTDWEDIAIDDAGNLYIADTGNNSSRRSTVNVFRIAEPDPAAKNDRPLPVTATYRLTFPDKPFDCESLFIWKDTGYCVSKQREGTVAGLYRFPLTEQQPPLMLEKVCDLPLHVPATGADISRDGKQIAIVTFDGPYLFDLPTPGDIPSIANAVPKHVVFTDVYPEAVCFTEDGLLTTTEKRPLYLFRWKDFGSDRK